MRAAIPWAVALAALVAAGVGWGLALRDHAQGVLRYEIPLLANATLPTGQGNSVAVSPGGRFVAYVAQSRDNGQRLYLRASDELEPRVVPGSEHGTSPFFSPDGDWVAFTVGGQLLKASVRGGAATALADFGAPTGGTWSPSGWLVVPGPDGGLLKVPATGGPPAVFTRRDSARGETAQFSPVSLSDGETILYTSFAMGGATAARIGVATLRDGTSTILELQGSFPLGVLDGYLIYTTAAGAVMAAPFDLGAKRVTGPSVALLDQAAVDASTGTTYAQMSPDGSLIYLSGVARRQIAIVSRDGSTHVAGEPGAIAWPRLSPDSKQLALSVGSLSRRDVWIYDLQGGPFTRLTTEGTINDRPEWTSDGTAVVFRSNRSGRNAIWKQSFDGATPASLVFGLSDSQIDEGVLSPDGRYLVVQRDRTGNGETWYRAMQGDTTLVHVEPTANTYGARFSPDGKWLVYTLGGATNAQVIARSFPSLSTRVQVSSNGGTTPVWSADGRRIYYTSSGQLWVANVESMQPLTIGSRSAVLPRGYTFNTVHADYDVARDGRIVALQSPSLEQQLVVVRNFSAELRGRLRGTRR